MNTSNPTAQMKQLALGLFMCRDDDTIKDKLKAAGLYEQMAESIRTSPGKDFLVLHQDAQGAHVFWYHGNPRDSGFVHYQAANPVMLLPLMMKFAEQSGRGAVTRH